MNVRKPLVASLSAFGLSLLALGATGGAAHAQDPAAAAPGQQRPGRANRQNARRQPPILRALAGLDLTDAQKAKIEPLVAKYQSDVAALAPEDRRTKSRELNQALLKDVTAQLTPEQQTKLRTGMRRAGGGAFGPLLRAIDATPEQRKAIDPIVKDANDKIAKLDDDATLKGRDKREKTQALVAEAVAKIKPNLTDEQKTKLDAAVAQMNQPRGAGNRAAGGNRAGVPAPGAGQPAGTP